MKKLLICFILLFSLCLYAQQKGAKPIVVSRESKVVSQNTYAVVVGISDYQDPAIPDLRFADKDAESFANYLRSNAGGKLDKNHLKVLINQQATMAQFGIALDWLIENAKEEDKVIIYFSGHGDVEKKTLTQPGFLLCWDAPSRVYIAGGTMALPILQEVISTLSLQNKSKVIVITDACHSGKLAGHSVNGSQATASNFSKQFANEIKIMSCQPNEYSIEGEQWGGGRGVFSFHLINALNGLADKDEDKIVSLQEAGRYLEDHVSTEVAPIKQVPMVVGDRYVNLSVVDENIFANLRDGKNNPVLLTSIDSKGIEDEVLEVVDTNIKKVYQQFMQAILDKKYLDPKNDCADFFYEKLIKEPSLQKLHSTMKRNYAAALMDDSQKYINGLLVSDPKVTIRTYSNLLTISKNNARHLERAADLLGKHHYIYRFLKANVHYFNGISLMSTSSNPNKSDKEKATAQFKEALEWQANMPHVYSNLIYTNPDSAEYFASNAISLAPNWLVPYIILARFNTDFNRDSNKALKNLMIAKSLDSLSPLVNYGLGYYYYVNKQYDKAANFIQKSIGDSLAKLCIPCEYELLGLIYDELHQFKLAEEMYLRAIQLEPDQPDFYSNLGYCYLKQNKFQEADEILNKGIKIDSDFSMNYYNLACSKSKQSQIKKAFEYLELAIKKGFNDYEFLDTDPDLYNLRIMKLDWEKFKISYDLNQQRIK